MSPYISLHPIKSQIILVVMSFHSQFNPIGMRLTPLALGRIGEAGRAQQAALTAWAGVKAAESC